MKAILLERYGEPSEVLQVRDVPAPVPGRNEVRVRMLLSPINPSDLLVVRGAYGTLPNLPATPGFEGVGVVEAVGPGLLRFLRGVRPGQRVAVPNSLGGTWRELTVRPALEVVPLPNDVPDEQAASFFVNPASAFVMTRRVLNLKPGDWLLQTAAGSALGRMVIRLGQKFGFRTINVVRRREQADELKKMGVEVICTNEESIDQRVLDITKGAGVLHAIDAVGGSTGQGVVRSLAVGGRLLVYGLLSGEPIPVDPRLLISGQRIVEGFWLAQWTREHGALSMLKLFRQIIQLMRENVLTTGPGTVFPMDQVKEAVKQAEIPGRPGKTLLRLSAK